MLTRTRTSSNPPAKHPRLFAAGRISPDTRELRAPSLFAPRQDEIEHRVTEWHPGCWVAEVRVNYRMTHHSIFRGDHAYEDAMAWCKAVAPHVTHLSVRFEDAGEMDAPVSSSAAREVGVLSQGDHVALCQRNAELVEAVRVARLKLAAAYGDEDAERELAALAPVRNDESTR